MSAAARIWFDGSSLSAGGVRGRSFTIDPRCLSGEPVRRAFAHVCALADDAAALAFDQPEVQQVRRDALAWWIPLLGDALVCLTTLALDESRYGGAITVTHAPVDWEYDPFARIFPGTLLRTDLFSHVPPPAGPRDRALRRRGVARRRLLGKPDVEVVVVAGDAADDAGRPSEAGARADMDCLRPHPA